MWGKCHTVLKISVHLEPEQCCFNLHIITQGSLENVGLDFVGLGSCLRFCSSYHLPDDFLVPGPYGEYSPGLTAPRPGLGMDRCPGLGMDRCGG